MAVYSKKYEKDPGVQIFDFEIQPSPDRQKGLADRLKEVRPVTKKQRDSRSESGSDKKK